MGHFVVRSLNEAFYINKLSDAQTQGLITCIPKGDKPKQYIKNWRPITLLNTVYKIGSGVIANRIKPLLPLLIKSDQTGFIKGRYIGESIRLIYDILHYTEENNIPGILLLIDFEKAFDSLSWSFINKTLNLFNFGPSIQKWFNVFYKDAKSTVSQCGFLSDFFKVERGCRQGDPLSCYIFILCAEILSIKIRSNPKIKGINPFPNKPLFSRVYSINLLKTLWEKEKLLVASNFSFSHSIFSPFGEHSAIFIKTEIVICKLFWFGRV